ncbi:hypothetical protein PInf_023749 [Phytophthora infestans]|nr:hypothetical protein PInf_023749 [Phytophthora infestans]
MLSREGLRRELEREWTLIESAEKKLVEEKKKVVAEWVSVEDAQREFDARRNEFETNVSKHFCFLPEETVIVFNVGGQLFKSTVKIWTRDRFSILAQLCTKSPKLRPDKDGSFFFDRDFWVFRLILAFCEITSCQMPSRNCVSCTVRRVFTGWGFFDTPSKLE